MPACMLPCALLYQNHWPQSTGAPACTAPAAGAAAGRPPVLPRHCRSWGGARALSSLQPALQREPGRRAQPLPRPPSEAPKAAAAGPARAARTRRRPPLCPAAGPRPRARCNAPWRRSRRRPAGKTQLHMGAGDRTGRGRGRQRRRGRCRLQPPRHALQADDIAAAQAEAPPWQARCWVRRARRRRLVNTRVTKGRRRRQIDGPAAGKTSGSSSGPRPHPRCRRHRQHHHGAGTEQRQRQQRRAAEAAPQTPGYGARGTGAAALRAPAAAAAAAGRLAGPAGGARTSRQSAAVPLPACGQTSWGRRRRLRPSRALCPPPPQAASPPCRRRRPRRRRWRRRC